MLFPPIQGGWILGPPPPPPNSRIHALARSRPRLPTHAFTLSRWRALPTHAFTLSRWRPLPPPPPKLTHSRSRAGAPAPASQLTPSRSHAGAPAPASQLTHSRSHAGAPAPSPASQTHAFTLSHWRAPLPPPPPKLTHSRSRTGAPAPASQLTHSRSHAGAPAPAPASQLTHSRSHAGAPAPSPASQTHACTLARWRPRPRLPNSRIHALTLAVPPPPPNSHALTLARPLPPPPPKLTHSRSRAGAPAPASQLTHARSHAGAPALASQIHAFTLSHWRARSRPRLPNSRIHALMLARPPSPPELLPPVSTLLTLARSQPLHKFTLSRFYTLSLLRYITKARIPKSNPRRGKRLQITQRLRHADGRVSKVNTCKGTNCYLSTGKNSRPWPIQDAEASSRQRLPTLNR